MHVYVSIVVKYMLSLSLSLTHFPPCTRPVRQVLANLRKLVAAVFPENELLCVGAFLFLRFLAPALIAPEGFALMKGSSLSLSKYIYFHPPIHCYAHYTLSSRHTTSLLTPHYSLLTPRYTLITSNSLTHTILLSPALSRNSARSVTSRQSASEYRQHRTLQRTIHAAAGQFCGHAQARLSQIL